MKRGRGRRRRTVLALGLAVLALAALLAAVLLRPPQPDVSTTADRATERTGTLPGDKAVPPRGSVKRGTREHEFPPAAACGIRGVVVDDGGTPIPGASIDPTHSDTVQADAEGRFRITVVPADRTLTVSATGYDRLAVPVVPVAGETLVLDPIVLAASAGLGGRVVDPDGQPLDEARVILSVDGASGHTRDWSDERGRFFLEGLVTGPATLIVAHRRHPLERVEIPGVEEGQRVLIPDVVMRVGGVLVGTIRAPDGSPVAGADVHAFLLDADTLRLAVTGAAADFGFRSDDDGRYRVTGLTTGAQTVRVDSKSHRILLRQGVAVREGETTTLDLTLEAGRSVRGRVLDPDGRPAPGAGVSVAVVWSFTSVQEAMRRRSVNQVKTDAEGRFELIGVGDDPVTIEVKATGAAPLRQEHVAPGTTDLLLRLVRATSVTGRVLDEATGAPVADARVRIVSRDVFAPGAPHGSARSDDDGAFELENTPAGEIRLRVTADGYAPSEIDLVTKTARRTEGVEVRLGRGATLRGVVVTAPDGRPVAGARVWVTRPGDDSETDVSGRFEIPSLPPGSHHLRVRAKGLATAHRTVALPSPDIRIVLTIGGSIRGVVQDVAGKPVPSATIIVSAGNGIDRTRTGPRGRYEFPHVAPGKVAVSRKLAEGTGFEMKSVVVEEGKRVTVDFGAAPGEIRSTVSGRLLAGGEPARGGMLSFLPLDGGSATYRTATTDSLGRYRLPDLSPGRYRVVVMTSGGDLTGVRDEIEVAGGGEVEHDVALPTGRLTGTVRGTGGPLQGAILVLLRPGRASMPILALSDAFDVLRGETRSGASGAFAFENVSRGDYHLLATADGFAPRLLERVTVANAGGVSVEVGLTRGESVTVVVADLENRPVADATVITLDERGRRLNTEFGSHTSGADGTVSLRLESGAYRVVVRSDDHAVVEHPIEVRGETTETIRLSTGGTLTIRVLGATGPAEGCAISLANADGREIGQRLVREQLLGGIGRPTTGADGMLIVPHVPPGKVVVHARTADGRSGQASVEVGDGKAATVDVTLR